MGVQEFVNQTLRRPAYVLPVAFVVLLLDFVALMVTGPTRVRTGTDRAGTVQPGEAVSPIESLAPEEAAAAAVSGTRRRSTRAAGTTVGKDTAISDTEIAVGIIYITNPGTANNAAGFTGVGQVNQKRGFELMVNEVNKNAPFGRKVVPVFYSSTEENAIAKGEGLWQEACTHWTQDNKVFLVWAAGTDTLKACLTRNKVAQIGQGIGFSWEKTFKDYPWYIEHNTAALDRMAQFEVDQLHARGFFSQCRTDTKTALACEDGKPRIALIRYDLPSYKAGAAKMKAALASHGLSLCDGCEFEMTLGATADLQAQLDDATEVQNAVVSCKGVHTAPGAPPGPCTHMLFLGSTAGCRQMTFYVQAAEEQQYRARIGQNGLDCGGTFWDTRGKPEYATNQFKESLLVGHSPARFGLRGSAFAECKKLFEAGGETFTGQEATNKELQIGGYCDTAWYHIAAFNTVGQTVNLDTFLNGVANTGAVKSVGAFLMRTTATRHDGAGAVRIGAWDPGQCRCWPPITGEIPV